MDDDASLRNQSLYKTRIIDASELGDAARVFDDLYERRLDAVILRGVFSRTAMTAVNDRLEKSEIDFREVVVADSTPKERYLSTYGINLNMTKPDLLEYFAEAAKFRAASRRLFRGEADFEERMSQVFSALAGGRPTSLVQAPGGEFYGPATIKLMPKDNQIKLHCGMHMLKNLQQFSHLKSIVDTSIQLSYFLTIQRADVGGELVMYDLEWSEAHTAGNPRGFVQDASLIRDVAWMSVRPEPGDVLIFDGGRIYHRVTLVEGDAVRRTMGGFACFSSDKQRVYFYT